MTVILAVTVPSTMSSAPVGIHWNYCRSVVVKPPKHCSGYWFVKLLRTGHCQDILMFKAHLYFPSMSCRLLPVSVDLGISMFLHAFTLSGTTYRFCAIFLSSLRLVVTALAKKNITVKFDGDKIRYVWSLRQISDHWDLVKNSNEVGMVGADLQPNR